MNRPVIMAGLFGVFALFVAAGCSSGSVASVAAPSSTPFAYPTATAVPVGYAATTADVSVGFFQTKVQIPATLGGSGYLTVTGSSNAPSGFAPPTAGPTLGYVTFAVSGAVTFNVYPTLTIALPKAPSATENFYAAFRTNDPSYKLSSWLEPAIGPATDLGDSILLTGGGISPPAVFSPNYQYVYCVYEVKT